MRQCTVCKIVRPNNEFYKHPTNVDGLFWRCTSCVKVENLGRYKKNPKKQNNREFEKKYKSPAGKKQELIAEQKGVCAICKQPFESSRKTHQDHCHASGMLRGVLCHNCNIGLGNFNDNIDRLQSAQEYLKRYSQQ